MHPFPAIEITFSPAWWTYHFGMDFSTKEAWQDPIRATERERQQRRLLYELFGDVGLGEPDPQPDPVVGGEFGHRFMSAFWGCEVEYLPAQWPHAAPLSHADERLPSLAHPEIEASWAVALVRKNASILSERYGKCRSAINFGGPLNNAVSVLGEAIFATCASDPELAQEVLRKMGQAVLDVHDYVESPINGILQGQERDADWGIGNCPVSQVSPQMYEKVVLPVDLEFRQAFKGANFSLHHCGIFHPYHSVYQPLQPTDLDVGPGTDLKLTSQAFPGANISAYFDPAGFASLSQEKIDRLVAQMIEDAAPAGRLTFIRAIEIGPELSHENVRNLMTVADRLKVD